MSPAPEPLSDEEALASWLGEAGWPAAAATPLASDVSPRRYLRLHRGDGATALLALYPATATDAYRRFVTSTALLSASGVRVPAVLATEASCRWMLVEDVGPSTLFDAAGRGWPELEARYAAALEQAVRIAALPAAPVAALNPPLDAARLAAELVPTREILLGPAGLLAESGLAAAFAAACEELARQVAAAPAVPCHRDFMARNLVPLEPAPGVAVLDHQDLRLGPPAYDLASLLNDSLFPPPAVERRLLTRFLATGGLPAYHATAAQRTLKAAGTYATFARRGERRHLPLIAPTLRRALRHLAAVPPLTGLARHLGRRWELPLAAGAEVWQGFC